jgi:protein-export membrane protein SecD
LKKSFLHIFNSKATFLIVFLISAFLLYASLSGLKIGDFELKGGNEMRYGIDIRGGVEATFAPKDLGRTPTNEELDSIKLILESRMDSANITDREIAVDKTNGAVIVRFPWQSKDKDFDAEKAVTELGETALLTFKDPSGAVVLNGNDVKKSIAQIGSDGKYQVVLELTEVGTTKFSTATGNLIGKKISIYMDNNLISAPTVQSKITTSIAQITNIGSLAEATSLSNKINSGSLPFSMVVNNLNIISPTLGSSALSVMVTAGLLAFILVCIFMLFYYRLPGLVACIALMLQVAGQLLALSIPQFTLTLPGIAGIILSIGMGVDANVIVSERIKEELNSGKTLRSSIDSGFHRAFTSVFDGNITVMIVSIMLIIFGSGSMLSFGYTLLCGVLMNFVAGVTASRLMIRSLSEYRPLQKPIYFGSRRLAN